LYYLTEITDHFLLGWLSILRILVDKAHDLYPENASGGWALGAEMTSNLNMGHAMAPSTKPSASSRLTVNHHAEQAPRQLPNSFIAAACGASVFDIFAGVVAVQTSPKIASCASRSNNNFTGYCGGPIVPSSGIFTNSGTIGGGVAGVSVDNGTMINTFTNTSFGAIKAPCQRLPVPSGYLGPRALQKSRTNLKSWTIEKSRKTPSLLSAWRLTIKRTGTYCANMPDDSNNSGY
jgi:hypothetical protein